MVSMANCVKFLMFLTSHENIELYDTLSRIFYQKSLKLYSYTFYMCNKTTPLINEIILYIMQPSHGKKRHKTYLHGDVSQFHSTDARKRRRYFHSAADMRRKRLFSPCNNKRIFERGLIYVHIINARDGGTLFI